MGFGDGRAEKERAVMVAKDTLERQVRTLPKVRAPEAAEPRAGARA